MDGSKAGHRCPLSRFCRERDASPLGRRNSLFFPAVREICGSGSSRRAPWNRQKPGPEQAANRRLLLPVTRFLRLCFCCVFCSLTGGENFLREKWSASKPFEVCHPQGLRWLLARPCKALFRELKSLFSFGFSGSKNLHRSRWTAGVPLAWPAQVSRRWAGFEVGILQGLQSPVPQSQVIVFVGFLSLQEIAANLDRGRPRPHGRRRFHDAGGDARGPSAAVR
jgi:hypothetical protein